MAYEALDTYLNRSAAQTALAEIGSTVILPTFTSANDDELNAFVTLEPVSG